MAGRRTVAKAKPITRRQVKGYDYVPNPGVKSLVAVNGRGAYRSARAEMEGLSPNARRRKARELTSSERNVFAKKVAAKEMSTMKRNRSRVRTTLAGRGAMRSNKAKAPSPAQLRARANFARMARERAAAARGRPMRRNAEPRSYAEGHEATFGKRTKTGKTQSELRAERARNLEKARRAKYSKAGRALLSRKKTPAELRAIRLRNLEKARAAKSAKARTGKARKAALKSKAGRTALRRSLASGAQSARATARRFKRYKHGRKLTKAERRAIALQNLQKAHAKRGTKMKLASNRRRKATRRRKSSRRQTPAQRAASLKNLRKARMKLKRNPKTAMVANRRRKATKSKATRRKAAKRTGRKQTAAQRAASLKNLRKARAAQRKRGYRRNAAGSRRRPIRRAARASARRVGRYRRNDMMDMVKTAAYIGGGLMAHKALMAVVDSVIVKNLFAPTPVVAPEATGSDNAKPLVSNLVSIGVAAVGIMATKSLIKDRQVANAICGGMAASAFHKLVVSVLSMLAPKTAGYLSGMDDGTAARLSAMYGYGAVSLQPMYAPISGYGAGYGEYFDSAMSGSPMGEYFESSLQGPLGEFFESGVEGLGNYQSNPDLYQAAAGYGSLAFGEDNVGNHILPTSDLDQQLTIAEAAAGVGSIYEAAAGYGASPYEAAAGVGEYFDSSMQGLGAIRDTPATSTWIPGESNPQLWAGTRPVTRGQMATANVPGGILETRGGAGIFG